MKNAANNSMQQTKTEWNELLHGLKEVVVPPHSVIQLDIQAKEYSTGYLHFDFSNGKDAIVQHLSAESYELEQRPNPLRPNGVSKGNRTDFQYGTLNGEWDSYTVAGRHREHYSPFWFRTFRYIRVKVHTHQEPLTISALFYCESNYPLQIRSRFQSSSTDFATFWDTSIRTLKNCMHETYEDCPYYEQSQFAFDTRSQMLFTYNLSGDDRLARKALHDFHSSQRPDGLISMRYPAHTNVILPVFSLFYPLMVHDHMMYFGDRELVTQYFPTCDSILNHFHRLITSEGLVGQFDPRYWSYVDWVQHWVFATPPAARNGPATYFSLVYAMALSSAARIADFIGRPAVGAEYISRKTSILEAVNKLCYDGEWYFDGPLMTQRDIPGSRSQHCQIYAVLSGAIEGDAARSLIQRMLKEPSFHKVSLSQTFYLFRALEEVGLYEATQDLWAPWKEMVDQGLDTWAEVLQSPRSDCHAWGASKLLNHAKCEPEN
jgi:hypothetical protein